MSVGGSAARLPEKIGKYRVVDRIGRGGMGMIFKAHDPILDRQVALKVISPEVEVTDELRARFFREAQACAKLNHPNIVTVYDMGEDEGRLFIVMELLEGDELRRLIAQRTALSLEEKLSVMLQVCSGLHYAHQKGIVHRDMKPGNIFLLKNGQTKILDFGIAHIASTDAGLTRTGLIMGTLRYISPEQVRGRADHRSDMFSIGSVFYELLTSRPPFLGDDPMQLLEQLRTEEPPPPSAIDPTVPVELSAIVQRAMRKNPAERFHDLDEMRSEIELIHGGLVEERQRIVARTRRQRERIVQLRAELAQRVGAPAAEEPIRPITERGGLTSAQSAEHEFSGLIEALEAKIAKADALAPSMQRANELLGAGRFEEAVQQLESIVTDMPEHRVAHDALTRARAEAEASRQRELVTEMLTKARSALDQHQYALCLEIVKQAAAALPADAMETIGAIRAAAEAGLAQEEALRVARQKADEAHHHMAQARADAEAEEAAQHAPAVWREAEAGSAAAEAALRREAYDEAKQAFDKAALAYRRSLDASRQAQLEQRRSAERARDMAKQGQNQARAVGAAQYAKELWDAAEAKLGEAQSALAARSAASAGVAFTEASALYRRAEEAAREARERERRRADAARERSAEGQRSAATVDAEHRAPVPWQDAVRKSTEGEAAFLRHQYDRATEAFEAALALYHQAQTQVRELTRRQRDDARKKQAEMAECRGAAAAVEAASHAPAAWNEAEATAAGGDRALTRDAWEDAARAFEQAATLYRRAEEQARDAMQARVDAEKAGEAAAAARRAAAEAQAGTYAAEALKEAESAETRAAGELSRREFASARPLFDDAARLYTAAGQAARAAADAEARRLEEVVAEAKRLLEAGDARASLDRVSEALQLRAGHAPAEALRTQAQERLRQAEEAARQAEAAARRAKEAAAAVLPDRDDATTVLIRPTKQPVTRAEDRDDATLVAVPPTAVAGTGPSRTDSAMEGLEAPPPSRTARKERGARVWSRWQFKVGAAAAVAAGGLVVIVATWRGQTPDVVKESPTARSTVSSPAPPVTQPPKPAPAPQRPTIDKAEADKAAADRAAAKAAADKAAAEKAVADKAAAERAAALKAAADKAAAEKAAAEQAAADKAAAERAAALNAAADKAAAEKAAADKAAAERAAALKAAADKAAAEKAAADRAAALKAAADKAAADRAAAAKLAADRAAAERAIAAKAAADKAAAEKAAAERAAADKAAADRAAAAERAAAEKAVADKAASDRLASERAAAERVAALRRDAENHRTGTEQTRTRAVRMEADQLARDLFAAGQTKQAEADGLLRRQEYAAASKAYEEAGERYMEAAMRAPVVRELRAQADAARKSMQNEKDRAEKQRGRGESNEFRAAVAAEKQAVSLYDQLSYREATDKFRAAETLFKTAAQAPTPAPTPAPGPPPRRQIPPTF